MTIIEALKTGLPLRRKGRAIQPHRTRYGFGVDTTWMPVFISPDFLMDVARLTKEDILAKDWIVMRRKKK